MTTTWTARSLLLALLIGCAGSGFRDSQTANGVPNLYNVGPRLWRSGQLPPEPAAWRELSDIIAPSGGPVIVIKLDDDVEGNDTIAETLLHWTVLHVPLPPEDDRPWTVLEKPDPKAVNLILDIITDAHARGVTVLWHCVHGRDRTGLITGLVERRLLGWSKAAAWKDMLAHGFRWELPNLDLYWSES